MTRRAFTLVELLVVIAVIGVLMGTLLPALSDARKRAHQAGGASNIRQLQIANAAFALAHDDSCMPAAVDMTPPTNLRGRENTHRWHGSRDEPSGMFRPEGGSITPFLDGASAAVRACPAFAPTLDELRDSGAGFESGCGGYGYNAAFVGSRRERDGQGRWNLTARRGDVVGDDMGSRVSRFRRPDDTIAFADTAFAGSALIEYSFAEPRAWPHLPQWGPDPSIHFRHRGRANVVWLDGHATAERRTATRDSAFYPVRASTAGIGWFGDTDGNELFDYD